jgi:hypothetical protein
MTATTAPAQAAARILAAAGLPANTRWDFGPASVEGHLPEGSTALTLRQCAGGLHRATWNADGTQVSGFLGRVPVTLRVAA